MTIDALSFSQGLEAETRSYGMDLEPLSRLVVRATLHVFVILGSGLAALASFAGSPHFYIIVVPVAMVSASTLFTLYYQRNH